MSRRSAYFPLGLTVLSGIYLWNLLAIRVEFETTYNDYFAIPVTGLVLLGSLVEALRAIRRPHDSREAETETVSRWFQSQRTRMALLIALFLAGFGRIPFIAWSTVFLVAAVALVDTKDPIAAPMGARQRAARYVAVMLGALALSAVLYAGFTQLGSRL